MWICLCLKNVKQYINLSPSSITGFKTGKFVFGEAGSREGD